MDQIDSLDTHQFIFTDLTKADGTSLQYTADKNLYPYVKIDGVYYINDGEEFTYTKEAALLMPITYGYQIENETWSGLALFQNDWNEFESTPYRINYVNCIDSPVYATKLDINSNDGGYKINYNGNQEYIFCYNVKNKGTNNENLKDAYNFSSNKSFGNAYTTNLYKFGTSDVAEILPFWTNESKGYDIAVTIQGNKLTSTSNGASKTVYLPYGSKLLLFLREGGTLSLTKTLPVYIGNEVKGTAISDSNLDLYVQTYGNDTYKGVNILTPQILLCSDWSGNSSSVLVNLSTVSYKATDISGYGEQSFAEAQISNIGMYTSEIEINSQTDVSFILNNNFTNLCKNFVWYPIKESNNVVTITKNKLSKIYFSQDDTFSGKTYAHCLLINDNHENYQIKNYFGLTYDYMSVNCFPTKELTTDTTSFEGITGTIEGAIHPYDSFAKLNITITDKYGGLCKNGLSTTLIDDDYIYPYSFKLDGISYTADTNFDDIAEAQGEAYGGTFAGAYARIKFQPIASYASWIAIAPPEWEEEIKEDLLQIDPSTVYIGSLSYTEGYDGDGNKQYSIHAIIKNTNNFSVYGTINYSTSAGDKKYSMILEPNTSQKSILMIVADYYPTQENNSTFKALGHNGLLVYLNPETTILNENSLKTTLSFHSNVIKATVTNKYNFPIEAKVYYYTIKANLPLVSIVTVEANSSVSYTIDDNNTAASVTLQSVRYQATSTNYIDIEYNITYTNRSDIIEV